MKLVEKHIPYTTKSKNGVEYTKYKKVYVDIDELERKEKQDNLTKAIDNIIK